MKIQYFGNTFVHCETTSFTVWIGFVTTLIDVFEYAWNCSTFITLNIFTTETPHILAILYIATGF